MLFASLVDVHLWRTSGAGGLRITSPTARGFLSQEKVSNTVCNNQLKLSVLDLFSVLVRKSLGQRFSLALQELSCFTCLEQRRAHAEISYNVTYKSFAVPIH